MELHTRTGHIGEITLPWDNGFYTIGDISDEQINFLIDSGSTASIISCKIFENFPKGIKSLVTSMNSDIQDVNGNAIENIGSLVLDVYFGTEIFPQKFIVCKIPSLHWEVCDVKLLTIKI